MLGKIWMGIDLRDTHGTETRNHGNARDILDGNSPSWYSLAEEHDFKVKSAVIEIFIGTRR